MKISLAVLFAVCCIGCEQTGPVTSEFFVEVLAAKNDLGDLALDDKGLFSADCRLGTRLVAGKDVSHPILEEISIANRVDESVSCFFVRRLAFDFCAVTSVQDDLGCKLSRGRDSGGWQAELDFRDPSSAHLLCTFACVNFE